MFSKRGRRGACKQGWKVLLLKVFGGHSPPGFSHRVVDIRTALRICFRSLSRSILKCNPDGGGTMFLQQIRGHYGKNGRQKVFPRINAKDFQMLTKNTKVCNAFSACLLLKRSINVFTAEKFIKSYNLFIQRQTSYNLEGFTKVNVRGWFLKILHIGLSDPKNVHKWAKWKNVCLPLFND